jgi:large subunit ribosomal protein L4
MPTVTVYGLDGQPKEEMELSARVFDAPVNVNLLHQATVTYLQNQRAGTAATKTRGMVRGGGRKPWKQKGTGRARQGSIRAPHWRHGGVAFGPHPRDYSIKLPQKMRQAAIRQALSAKLADGELMVVEHWEFPVIRTKQVMETLANLKLEPNALLVSSNANERLKLSARNLPKVETVTANSLNAYTLLKHKHVVLSKDAVMAIEEVFGR